MRNILIDIEIRYAERIFVFVKIKEDLHLCSYDFLAHMTTIRHVAVLVFDPFSMHAGTTVNV